MGIIAPRGGSRARTSTATPVAATAAADTAAATTAAVPCIGITRMAAVILTTILGTLPTILPAPAHVATRQRGTLAQLSTVPGTRRRPVARRPVRRPVWCVGGVSTITPSRRVRMRDGGMT